MAGVYCPNCGRPVLGIGSSHKSRCGGCDAKVTARWDEKTMVVTWNDHE